MKSISKPRLAAALLTALAFCALAAPGTGAPAGKVDTDFIRGNAATTRGVAEPRLGLCGEALLAPGAHQHGERHGPGTGVVLQL
jgi:hypothetical protein